MPCTTRWNLATIAVTGVKREGVTYSQKKSKYGDYKGPNFSKRRESESRGTHTAIALNLQ